MRRAAVLDAGLDIFSTVGLHGASLDQIAERAGLSKTNLLYYFPSKEELYVAVLRRVLDVWLDPLQALDTDSDPAEALGHYIRTKLALSRDAPQASRLFCLEVVQGAPLLRSELAGPLRALVEAKATILRGWIEAGLIIDHDPYHLVFAIWAITQHYADFAAQIDAITGRDLRVCPRRSDFFWVVCWASCWPNIRSMWTSENRSRYDRSRLRYPSDLTDEEWALVAPLIPRAKRGLS